MPFSWDAAVKWGGLVGGLIGAVGGGLYVALTVASALSGQPEATRDVAQTVAAGAVGGLVWLAGFTVSRWAEGRRTTAAVVAPDALLNEWTDLADRILTVYGRQAAHTTSFSMASLDVTVALNKTDASKPETRVVQQMRNDFTQDTSADISLSSAKWLLHARAARDVEALSCASQIIRQILVDSARHADNFALIARSAGAENLDKWISDSWTRFANASNSLAETFEGLQRRSTRFVRDETFYITRVRAL